MLYCHVVVSTVTIVIYIFANVLYIPIALRNEDTAVDTVFPTGSFSHHLDSKLPATPGEISQDTLCRIAVFVTEKEQEPQQSHFPPLSHGAPRAIDEQMGCQHQRSSLAKS